jgi:hypothetical protein
MSTSFLRRVLAVCLVFMMALSAVSTALAGGIRIVTIGSFSATCTTATVSFSLPESGSVNVTLEIHNVTDGTIITQISRTVPGTGTYSQDFGFPAQDSGDFLQATLIVFQSSVSSSAVAVSCTGGSGPQCADGRINFNHCDKVAIYPVKDEGSYGIEIFRVEPEGIGHFELFFSALELDALPDVPDENILIGASGLVSLWKLTNGQYLAQYGPDMVEGKTFQFMFDGLPPETYPTVTTF